MTYAGIDVDEWQNRWGRGESRARRWHKKEGTRRLSVEAKAFVLDIGEKKGLLRGVIEEQWRGTSSWVWPSPASLSFFLEGIKRSFKEPKEEQWDWS